MTQPTYAQYRAFNTAAASLSSEQIWERILSALAAFMSGQNPDGSSIVYPHP